MRFALVAALLLQITPEWPGWRTGPSVGSECHAALRASHEATRAAWYPRPTKYPRCRTGGEEAKGLYYSNLTYTPDPCETEDGMVISGFAEVLSSSCSTACLNLTVTLGGGWVAGTSAECLRCMADEAERREKAESDQRERERKAREALDAADKACGWTGEARLG